ncbi:hypothetical protein AB0I46_20085 [Streptomyces spectabilis]|uniref:hypothetical protein n=1 Tax=Streptomyces spectabilis TaxID=68270 RepID=UPI0033CCE81D
MTRWVRAHVHLTAADVARRAGRDADVLAALDRCRHDAHGDPWVLARVYLLQGGGLGTVARVVGAAAREPLVPSAHLPRYARVETRERLLPDSEGRYRPRSARSWCAACRAG